MDGIKSETCLGKISGKFLTEYNSKNEAETGAKYAENYGNKNLIAYECLKCGKWHLTPKNRQTASTKCLYCKGSDGKYKDLYKSRSDAKKRSEIIKSEQGINLKIYKCQYSKGWHLTKNLK